MEKMLQKVIASVLVVVLTGINLLVLGTEAIAEGINLTSQNSKTNHANVEFDSYFEGKTHVKEFKEEEGKNAKLYLELKINNTGYLKNGIVKFSDANYSINTNELKNENIQNANSNQINLKQINNSAQSYIIEVPMQMLKDEKVFTDNFSKVSQIELIGTYVDGEGKERKINKTIQNQVKWNIDAVVELKEELTKYIPYKNGEEYGVILQTKINSKIQENKVPVSKTELNVKAPQIAVDQETMQKIEQEHQEKIVQEQASQENQSMEDASKQEQIGTNQTENQIKPDEIKVIAGSTKASNGNKTGEYFTQNNYNYNKETAELTISVENNKDNQEKIAWVKDAEDEYFVTYIYKGKAIYDYANKKIQEAQNISSQTQYPNNQSQTENTPEQNSQENQTNKLQINSQIKASITVWNSEGQVIEGNISQNYILDSKKGELVDHTMETTSEVSKGYIYANYLKDEKIAKNQAVEEKQETNYYLKYIARINYAEMVDKIEWETEKESFIDQNGHRHDTNKENKNFIYNKSVKIKENIFKKMLGEEGKLQIQNENEEVLGEITKDTPIDANGNYTLDISQNRTNKIKVVSSNLISEGDLEIVVEKAISTEIDYTKEEMQTFTGIIIPTNMQTKQVKLVEPVSKAQISMQEGKENLSTIVENKNIELRVTLDTSSVYNALYQNPVLEIELPQAIENIKVNDVNLLFTNELQIKQAKLVTENGKKKIRLVLEGTQTEYSLADEGNSVETKGPNIVINADITLKKLTPKGKGEIKLYYINEATNLYEENQNEQRTNATQTTARRVQARTTAISEEETKGTAKVGINYIAPNGVVAANTIKGYNGAKSQLMNMSDEPSKAEIETYSQAKQVTIEGTIINNYDNSIGNVVILGRIPFQGNKKIDTQESLGSTFNTKLKSNLTVNAEEVGEVKVYYSENGEATKDLSESSNGWTLEPQNLENVKSYLMVFEEDVDMESATQMTFNYEIEVPANLAYNNNTAQMYKVYYSNKAQEVTMQETKLSSVTQLTTGEGPELEVKLTSNVEENSTIYGERYIRVWAEVKNISKVEANNVKVTLNLPESFTAVKYEESLAIYGKLEKAPIHDIGTLKPDETKKVEFYVLAQSPEVIHIEDIPGAEEGENGEIIIPDGVEPPISIKPEDLHKTVMKAEVTADKIEKPITSPDYVIKVEEGDIQIVNFVNTRENRTYGPNSKIKYEIRMELYVQPESLVLTVPLPDGVKEVNAYWKGENKENKKGITIEKDKITVNIDSQMQENLGRLMVEYTLGEKVSKTISTKVFATVNGNRINYSDERYIYVQQSDITGNQVKPVKEYVKEDEEFEYKFVIKTQGGIQRNVQFIDELAEELQIVGYDILVKGTNSGEYDGTHRSEQKDNKLIITYPILGQDLEITITIKVKGMLKSEKDDGKAIVNKAVISSIEAGTKELNSVTNYLEYDPRVHVDQNIEGPTTPDETYRITGLAWLDENKNGQREETEKLLPNIKVMLLNKNGNSIVTDKDTKQNKITQTNENGQYSFNNLPKGEYLVMFIYGAGQYDITTYMAKDVDEGVNSDAISMDATIDGEKVKVGITNIINITDKSVRNIDIGLYVAEKFDLRLDKYISKITLTTPTIGTSQTQYNNSKIQKVEVLGRNVGKSSIVVEYKIVVTNEGAIPGYAKKVIDYLPKDAKFSSELNKDWYVSQNGSAYTTKLENEKIMPGQSKEVTLVLSYQINKNNIGTTIQNEAEIYESFNEKGMPDIDSKDANKLETEDDMSDAKIVLSTVTGKIVMYTSITIGVIIILIIGIYEIKKRVLKK